VQRWSWNDYILLDEVIRIQEVSPAGCLEIHVGSDFSRRVLTLACETQSEARYLVSALRALLRFASLGDRDFTMYATSAISAIPLFMLTDPTP
jgi:hypothetical protein